MGQKSLYFLKSKCTIISAFNKAYQYLKTVSMFSLKSFLCYFVWDMASKILVNVTTASFIFTPVKSCVLTISLKMKVLLFKIKFLSGSEDVTKNETFSVFCNFFVTIGLFYFVRHFCLYVFLLFFLLVQCCIQWSPKFLVSNFFLLLFEVQLLFLQLF